MTPILRALLLLSVLAGAAGCGDDDPVTPTQPTPPQATTETFSGTLTVNGAVTHSFTAGQSGVISATVTELVPDSAAVIGVSLGTWNPLAGTCQLLITNDNATQNGSVTGTAGAAGSFCARVYDVGHLTSATGYTLTVVHF